jgi:hypothetical protein
MWSEYGEMPSPKIDSHDSFLHLYVECKESLRGFASSLLPTLVDAREVMQEKYSPKVSQLLKTL